LHSHTTIGRLALKLPNGILRFCGGLRASRPTVDLLAGASAGSTDTD